MARQREKFDRIDVPRDNPYRNVIGVVVCVVALAAAALTFYLVWDRVQMETRLGDTELSDVLDTQSQAAVPDGYTASADDLVTVALLTADGLGADATLQSARVLVINRTQGTAALATVPLEAKLTVDDAATTMADLSAQEGPSAVLAPLARACGVRFDHAVVSTDDVLEEVASLVGADASNLVSEASGLLSRMRTDLDAAGLLSLAEALSTVGTANAATVEVALTAETATDADGNVTETGYQLVDATALAAGLGVIVPAA